MAGFIFHHRSDNFDQFEIDGREVTFWKYYPAGNTAKREFVGNLDTFVAKYPDHANILIAGLYLPLIGELFGANIPGFVG